MPPKRRSARLTHQSSAELFGEPLPADRQPARRCDREVQRRSARLASVSPKRYDESPEREPGTVAQQLDGTDAALQEAIAASLGSLWPPAPGAVAPAPSAALLATRELVAEQDAAYEMALAADRAAEEARAAAERAAQEAAAAAERAAQERQAWLAQQWRDCESQHGCASAESTTHQLRVVSGRGQLRVAFQPSAPIAALCALVEAKLGYARFRLRLDLLPDPEASQPIGSLPNRSVVRVEPV